MTKSQATLTERQYKVSGLDCQSCAMRLEEKVKKLDSVENATVSFMEGVLTARARNLSQDEIAATAHSLGFTAREIKNNITEMKDPESDSDNTIPVVKFEIAMVVVSALLVLLSGIGSYQDWAAPFRLSLILAAIALSGRSIAWKGVRALFRFQLDMNFLMSAAVIGALFIGEWLEAGVIVVLFAVSEILENASINRSRRAIEQLVKLAPQNAIVLSNGSEVAKPVESIHPGEILLVKPGSMIPLDGKVKAGFSSINEAAITGESLPVSKSPGSPVLAGSINGEGALEIRVEKASGDTTLDRIIKLVQQAQAHRAPVQAFVEKFARYYTPVVVLAAILVAVVPPMYNGAWTTWIYRALALLVIACPCALVISTPVAIISALAGAARNGVLIKGGTYLEILHKARAIAFDKTGTVTEGSLQVRDIYPLNGLTPHELLAIAASVESHSEHPIAKTILDHAVSENVQVDSPVNFTSLPGLGARALVENRTIYVGNHNLFEELKICDGSPHDLLNEVESDNKSAVLIGSETEVYGLITLSDRIRTTAKSTISELRQAGVSKVFLLTGDKRGAGKLIGDELGVDVVKSELLPEHKVNEIKQIQHEYNTVAMVGDGVNDAPALATADIGIAMGGAGTDAALETADVVLMSDRIDKLPWVYRLSKKTHRIIVENISFAILLKLLFIILALTGKATLWMAVFADTGVTILVIFNGMRALKCR